MSTAKQHHRTTTTINPTEIRWSEACKLRIETLHGMEAATSSRERWLAGETPESPVIVVATPDGWYGADGYLRTQGAIRAGIPSIEVEVLPGDEIDAIAYGIRVNGDSTRPLRLTRADIAARLSALFTTIRLRQEVDPTYVRPSNAQIAKLTGVVPTTVSNHQKRLGLDLGSTVKSANGQEVKPAGGRPSLRLPTLSRLRATPTDDAHLMSFAVDLRDWTATGTPTIRVEDGRFLVEFSARAANEDVEPVTPANDDVETPEPPRKKRKPSTNGTVLTYPGGKTKLLSTIEETIRQTVNVDSIVDYREPFFGGGGVGRNILKSNLFPNLERLWINDRDPGVTCLWSAVIHHPEKLKRHVRAFVPSVASHNEFYERLKGTAPDGEDARIEFGFQKLALHKTSYSGLGLAGGRRKKVNANWNADSICAAIDREHARLTSKGSILCTQLDFIEVIRDACEGTFIYLDPPYWIQGEFLYEHSFIEADHVRLVEALRTTKAKWVLSYDDHPAIRKLYEGWADVRETNPILCSIGPNGKGKPKPTKPELIITPRIPASTPSSLAA